MNGLLSPEKYTNQNYTVYMYRDKIIVCTKLQCFSITEENYRQTVHIKQLKSLIVNGKIETVSDIAHYSNKYLLWNNLGGSL